MQKIILLLLIALMAVSCSPKTEYTYTYDEIVVDSVAVRQYALDLLVASNGRHYTDKTKRRYDISTALQQAGWSYRTRVEGLNIWNYSAGDHLSYHIFVPEAYLTEEQRYYFDMSKDNGGIKIVERHKKIRLK